MCVHENVKNRLNSENACYLLVQESLSFHLLSKNMKMKIYGDTVFPVVLCSCETQSLILREGHRLRVFEKRVLRKIFGPKREDVTGD
jgi:hypothetical protein